MLADPRCMDVSWVDLDFNKDGIVKDRDEVSSALQDPAGEGIGVA